MLQWQEEARQQLSAQFQPASSANMELDDSDINRNSISHPSGQPSSAQPPFCAATSLIHKINNSAASKRQFIPFKPRQLPSMSHHSQVHDEADSSSQSSDSEDSHHLDISNQGGTISQNQRSHPTNSHVCRCDDQIRILTRDYKWERGNAQFYVPSQNDTQRRYEQMIAEQAEQLKGMAEIQRSTNEQHQAVIELLKIRDQQLKARDAQSFSQMKMLDYISKQFAKSASESFLRSRLPKLTGL
ncbi:hypothetical protein FGO68_gene1271 [Halteria grandinella]|uniref:Uncharacterized protein n=1 Tax=Halteria grandinella TaxID=5974 RepID=A0A8J8SVS5_HALGN|nr:hypothetical protein FGO68_gene1271 [Halteria grandinella]